MRPLNNVKNVVITVLNIKHISFPIHEETYKRRINKATVAKHNLRKRSIIRFNFRLSGTESEKPIHKYENYQLSGQFPIHKVILQNGIN